MINVVIFLIPFSVIRHNPLMTRSATWIERDHWGLQISPQSAFKTLVTFPQLTVRTFLISSNISQFFFSCPSMALTFATKYFSSAVNPRLSKLTDTDRFCDGSKFSLSMIARELFLGVSFPFPPFWESIFRYSLEMSGVLIFLWV